MIFVLLLHEHGHCILRRLAYILPPPLLKKRIKVLWLSNGAGASSVSLHSAPSVEKRRIVRGGICQIYQTYIDKHNPDGSNAICTVQYIYILKRSRVHNIT